MQPEQTPSQESAPSSATLLDALRRRLMPEVNAGAAQRLSDIGIGMLASGSPDFFTALGKGLQAGNAAETNRLQMLRQAAETEEQAAYRKAQLDLERAKQAYTQDPNNPNNRAVLMQAEAAMTSAQAAVARANREMRDPWQVTGVDAATGSLVATNMRDPRQREILTGTRPMAFGGRPLDARTYANMYNQAESAALRAYPDPAIPDAETPDQKARRMQQRRDYTNRRLQELLEAAQGFGSGQLPTPGGTAPAPTQEPGRIQSSLTGTPTRRPVPAATE